MSEKDVQPVAWDGVAGFGGVCMTRDDILRMAREAGIDVKAAFPRNPDVLTRFAQLAVDAAQPATGPDAQPVAFLQVGFMCGAELEDWELEAKRGLCDELNEKHINKPTALPLYTHPPAAAVQDLVAALMMIAGKQRCVDSLMSNVDIALEALKRWEGK